MIKVSTTRFGEIEINEAETIILPQGIIGFPDLKQYVLLDHDRDSPFKWLQALEDGEIAFVLMNPLLFRPDYSIEVSETEINDLDLKSEEDAVISVIITMPSNPQHMTANLKAPLIFNLKNRKGKQVILNSAQFTTRHHVLEEMKKYAATEDAQEKSQSTESLKQEVQATQAKKSAKKARE